MNRNSHRRAWAPFFAFALVSSVGCSQDTGDTSHPANAQGLSGATISSAGDNSSAQNGGTTQFNGGGGVNATTRCFPIQKPTSSANADPRCDQPETNVIALTSDEQAQALMVGKWSTCGEKFRFGSLGVEFRTDGTYSPLPAGEQPTLQADGGVANSGTWKISSYATMSGLRSYSVAFTTDNGWNGQDGIAFSEKPQKVRFSSVDGPHDFVRAPTTP